MTNKIARRLFDDLLKESRIDQGRFYDLVRALEGAPYIDRSTITMTHKQPYASLTLMAKYTGSEQIGNARLPRRRVNSDVKKTVIRIYGDISRRSRVQFTRVLPSLDDNDCIGYAIMGPDDESLLPLVLTDY